MNAIGHLLCAEWQKTTGNRWAVGTLIGLFPIMAVVILILTTLVALGGSPEAMARMGIASGGQVAYWPDYFLFAWAIPSTPIGRWLLIAFTAVAFAGEYQWGTWKNLAARRTRASLVAAKFVTLSLLIVASFTLMSLILGFGMLLPVSIAGGTYGPALDGPLLADFAGRYLGQAGLAFASALVAAGYAALAAIVTRAILGSVLIGIGAFLLEEGLAVPLGLLGTLFHRPEIVALIQLTPSYNLQNLLAWARTGGGHTFPPLDLYAQPNSPELSIVILLVWIAGLIGLTLYSFHRQDILN